MTAETGRFRRSDRLRKSRDFKRVAARGDRYASNSFVLLVAPGGPTSQSPVRLGITTGKHVGNAIVRNRVKRAIRGWFRVSSDKLTSDKESNAGLDFVVIARKPAAELDTHGIADELSGLAARRNRRVGRAASPSDESST